MLVTFSTTAYADIQMFGDVAAQLLKLMDHSGSVPGAILAEDVPAALERLQAAVEAGKQQPDQKEPDSTDEGEIPVALAHRALPLIELLQAAAAAKANVMWDGSH